MALGSIFIRPCPLKNRGRSTPCPFPQGGHGALHTPSSHGGHAHRGDRRRASKQKQVLGPDSKPCRRLGLWFSAVSVKPDTLLCAGKLGSSPDGSQARAQSARSCFAVKTVCSLRGSPGARAPRRPRPASAHGPQSWSDSVPPPPLSPGRVLPALCRDAGAARLSSSRADTLCARVPSGLSEISCL